MLSWLWFGSSSFEEDDDTVVPVHFSQIKEAPHIVGCSSSNYTSYVHSRETWRYIQNAYDVAKGRRHDKDGRAPSYTGVTIDFHIESDPTVLHGRALVTNEFVPRGTRVWKPYHNGQFKHNAQTRYYKFLSLLPHNLQCDVLEMSHVMYDGSVIEIALDEGNYIHDADRPEQVNLNDTASPFGTSKSAKDYT
jgi:hypothetical protein